MQIDWFLVGLAVVAIPLFLLSLAVNKHRDKKPDDDAKSAE